MLVWRKGSRDSANRGVSTTSSKSQNSPKCEYIDRAYDKGVNEKTEAARGQPTMMKVSAGPLQLSTTCWKSAGWWCRDAMTR